MQLLLRKIKELGLGAQPMTEANFYEICDRENIRVIRDREPFSYWMNLDGEHCIVLHDKLHGARLLFTMFHELAHHFLHSGRELNQIEAYGANESSKEYEADTFAVLVLYPVEALGTVEYYDAELYDPNLRKIRRERERIYFLYGV